MQRTLAQFIVAYSIHGTLNLFDKYCNKYFAPFLNNRNPNEMYSDFRDE